MQDRKCNEIYVHLFDINQKICLLFSIFISFEFKDFCESIMIIYEKGY